ncbi:hypothetical protein D9758_016144 [Tetrapyrgos nigripes]|uniref:Uncharacterized protein n=1 Tax=Tetrapyrgos nigripes TaxID=182062 RepID=A0A8H5FIQ4_9AGAR|nr:hypothetical protein D9758_016144 [Tetrapyrgos nigripes]
MKKSSVSLHRLTPLNSRPAPGPHQTTPPNTFTPQATAPLPSSLRTPTHNPSTRLVASIAREVGFTQVSQNAKLVSMTKLVFQGVSCTADAYLITILHQYYLDDFLSGFDAHSCKGSGASTSSASSSSGSKSTGRGDKREKEGTRKPRVEFMSPPKGLVDTDRFSGLKSILNRTTGVWLGMH